MADHPWDLAANLKDVVLDMARRSLLLIALLFVLTLPMTVFKNMFENELTGYWITLGALMVYFVVLMAIWRLTGALRFEARRTQNSP